ncbi:hypothetical protein N5D61_24770 [Pseudomonas sp. GD03842]|uniref:hypothetical protein n=1 Tax=Pseudomonas sp. GD03842 TaxID=2975385 RepID=UPI002449A4B4|nr:hypothetical protein [Pseudomonas sp. GD03842]MDH0749543.1 hypothetical protein [Pseudomonas sp. GD03842]
MLNNPLAEWRAGIRQSCEFITDPDGFRRKLSAFAVQACAARQVGPEELNEMLELVDAGRDWALIELEEADAIGLFGGGGAKDGMQVFRGKG